MAVVRIKMTIGSVIPNAIATAASSVCSYQMNVIARTAIPSIIATVIPNAWQGTFPSVASDLSPRASGHGQTPPR